MAEKEDKSTKKDDEDLHAEGLRIHKVAIDRDSDNRERYARGRPLRAPGRAVARGSAEEAREGWPAVPDDQPHGRLHPPGGQRRTPEQAVDQVPRGRRRRGPVDRQGAGRRGRNIEYSSNADVAYDTALDNAVTGGFGYFRITTDYAADDVFDQDIRIERIANSLSVVPDPYCMDADSANWNDAFITETYSLDAFKKKWPEADVSSFEGDRKDVAPDWLEGDDIMVAEWWTRREVELPPCSSCRTAW
jgi:hypothetical protein